VDKDHKLNNLNKFQFIKSVTLGGNPKVYATIDNVQAKNDLWRYANNVKFTDWRRLSTEVKKLTKFKKR